MDLLGINPGSTLLGLNPGVNPEQTLIVNPGFSLGLLSARLGGIVTVIEERKEYLFIVYFFKYFFVIF